MQRWPTIGMLSALAALPLALLGRPQDLREGFTQDELETVTEEIKEEVEELRGLQFERPVAVSLTDREGFLAYARQRLEMSSSPEEIAGQEALAKLSGLLPADYDLLAETFAVLEEQVGGFYDPSNDAFYLMEGFGGGLARIILAHELTHALDDQHFDIDGRIETLLGDSDALFAYHAVVEGSGTAVMNRWTIEHLSELDAAALAGGGGISMEAVSKAPPFVWKPLIATYLCGASFLQKSDSILKGQMGAPDPDDFDRAFRQPPRSSEQVLHPEKYWDAEQLDVPQRVTLVTEGLSPGWSVLYQDTLGELGLALVTAPLEGRGGLDPNAILALRFTNDAAAGWDGDRVALLGAGQKRVLASVSVWDDGDEAQEFVARLGELDGHLRGAAQAFAASLGVEGTGLFVRREGERPVVLVAVGAGLDDAALEELVGTLSFELDARGGPLSLEPASAEDAASLGGDR